MATITAMATAIRAKLAATSAVTSLVGTRIVSLFSRGTPGAYPYLAFGLISTTEPGEAGMFSQRWQFTACAGALGMSSALDVLEAVKATLHMGSLTATGWTVYEIRLITTRTAGGGPDQEHCWAHADYYVTVKTA